MFIGKEGINPDVQSIKILLEQINNETPSLTVKGLMCIDAKGSVTNDCSTCSFARMNSLIQEFPYLSDLSMGMTHDYRHALIHCTTILRIGSGIFGSRD